MDKANAQNLLKEIVLNAGGSVLLSRHCRERMKERNVTMDDILNVIAMGEVAEIEEDDDTLRCRVKGEDIDGDRLTFVTAINPEKKVVCITVF